MKAFGEYRLALFWLLVVSLVAAVALFKGSQLYRVDTDLMQLLPSTEQQPAVEQGRKHLAETAQRRLLLMVAAASRKQATDIGVRLQGRIQQSGFLHNLDQAAVQSQWRNFYQELYPYRYQLLANSVSAQIRDDPQRYLQQNKEQLYGPMAFTRTQSLKTDPLYLFGSYIEELFPATLDTNKGVLLREVDGVHYGLVVAEVNSSAFDLDQQERLLALIDELRAALPSEVNLQVTGLPLYAASGSSRAQREIRLVGLGSLVAVVLLLISAFGSIRPLLLAIIAISAGIAAAWTISGFLFGRLHILTLVFGASLVGVAVDYCLHYFCSHLSGTANGDSATLVVKRRQVVRTMALALVTSVVAYLAMASAPFPGLRQMAAFSALGLVFSWLTVVLLFPLLLSRFSWPERDSLLSMTGAIADQWVRFVYSMRWSFVALLAVIVVGAAYLESEDDVRQLQVPSPELKKQEEWIKLVLPNSYDSRFFVVDANSEDQLMDRERQLAESLRELQKKGELSAYQALSQLLPDEQQQRKNYHLLQNTLYENGAARRYLNDLGFDDLFVEGEYAAFEKAGERTLSLVQIAATAPDHWKTLFLGCEKGTCRSVVRLQGVSDVNALVNLKLPEGVYWVDTVRDVSAVMATYRQRASLLLLFGVVAAIVLLSFWLGKKRALLSIAVPVVSIAITLGVLGWLGETLNLFRIFALLLLLGIGADFGIFAVRQRHFASHTALAIGLSAATTLLAFGLLSVSDTEAVRSFGQTLLIGIAIALAVAPVAAKLQESQNVR